MLAYGSRVVRAITNSALIRIAFDNKIMNEAREVLSETVSDKVSFAFNIVGLQQGGPGVYCRARNCGRSMTQSETSIELAEFKNAIQPEVDIYEINKCSVETLSNTGNVVPIRSVCNAQPVFEYSAIEAKNFNVSSIVVYDATTGLFDDSQE